MKHLILPLFFFVPTHIGRMVVLQKLGCERNRRGRHSSAVGGENIGTRIERLYRSSNISFPMCVDHQKRMFFWPGQ